MISFILYYFYPTPKDQMFCEAVIISIRKHTDERDQGVIRSIFYLRYAV